MKISALPSTLFPASDFEFPASKAGSTNKLTVLQVMTLAHNLVKAGVPGALDNLEKIGNAIANDSSYSATIAAALAGKQPLDGMLTAMAALTSAAGKFLAFSGADAPAVRDINGTVSGSYASPTGALAEYGSNANGYYYRYSNGLQICTHDQLLLSFFNSASLTRTWTFPAAFVNNLYSVGLIGLSAPAAGHRESTFYAGSLGTTSVIAILIDNANSYVSGDSYNASAIAIGRWV